MKASQLKTNNMSDSSRVKNDSPWIKRPMPNEDAQLRLFCFPYAGGSASIFRNWPEYLSSDIEVCAIQLPGRESRFGESALTCLNKMVTQLVDVMEPYMDRPFVFYGHSMGTLIAFELARELRRQQKSGPLQLLVSGRCAPHIQDPCKQLHHLPEAEFIQGLRDYNGTPEAVFNNSELMELIVPLIRADFTVCETFKYKQELPLECPISAFAGVDEVSSRFLQEWNEQTTNNFESELFSGDHFFINTEQEKFVSALSKRLEYHI